MSARLLHTPDEVRAALEGAGRVGFVPTMGYLHGGHATLIRRAHAECGVVVVSVFVNPRQFGTGEDLSRYPRDLARDLEVVGEAGADFLFHPSVAAMYPDGYATTVSVGRVSGPPEGTSRPGHFDGVATVVLKLLNVVRPHRAYFGEKDWQQLAVVRQMVRDLDVPVGIVGVPTVREASGLALSSRNSYLSAEQRERAAVLSRALRAVQDTALRGEREVKRLRQSGLDVLATEPGVQLDYLTVVDGNMTEHPQATEDALTRVLIAARMFGVRLIDNMPLWPESTPSATMGGTR
ncbi:pantoate--beta-alanine ligase [Deinococcus hopiensis]|uniref:Pantothenate synthetase n=1 Tax=Deinococcus hopiensis KR-140 TaxID=695939 RepID=A0A1W1VG71_9DEIO|nr:pantoate--beta-alanine ligase [Deinococcus hopiensis]SMB92345.1 pantothenate synthetase [Deinococcus hopiensis KR-140]